MRLNNTRFVFTSRGDAHDIPTAAPPVMRSFVSRFVFTRMVRASEEWRLEARYA